MMANLHINNPAHYADFITLNEQWIAHYFRIEESDRQLAANPGAVIEKGGYILSLTEDEQVIAVCALFKQSDNTYELARLAVDTPFRRKGHADRLINESLSILYAIGAKRLELMSNTKLTHALALYHKHGFQVLSQGPHPIYKRTNITMAKDLPG